MMSLRLDTAEACRISMGFQKQNALKYSDLIDEYGRSLGEDAEIWSDLSLLPLVRSNNIEERILASLSRQYSGNGFQDLALVIEIQVQAFHDEIEDWRRCLPEEIKSLRESAFNLELQLLITQFQPSWFLPSVSCS